MAFTEKPAKGVRGFILYNPFTNKRFFRIYNPENKREFKDYDITIEELEVEVLSGGAAFFEYDLENNRLDWSSDVVITPNSKLEEFTFEGGPHDGEKRKLNNVKSGIQLTIKDKRYTYKRDGMILKLEKEEDRNI